MFTDDTPKRFFGLYRAVVVDSQDPLNQGRLRVQIPQVLGTSITNWIPACVGSLVQHNNPYAVYSSTVSQQVTAANTPTVVTYNVVEEQHAMKLDLAHPSRVSFTQTGAYNIQFSVQLSKTGGSATTTDFWFRKNGVDLPRSNSRVTLANPADTIAAWNYVITIAPTDYFEIVFSSADSTMMIEAYTGLTSPVRPDVPSVIMTATPVANFSPTPGAVAWVMFEGGDPNFPVWIGSN